MTLAHEYSYYYHHQAKSWVDSHEQEVPSSTPPPSAPTCPSPSTLPPPTSLQPPSLPCPYPHRQLLLLLERPSVPQLTPTVSSLRTSPLRISTARGHQRNVPLNGHQIHQRQDRQLLKEASACLAGCVINSAPRPPSAHQFHSAHNAVSCPNETPVVGFFGAVRACVRDAPKRQRQRQAAS